MFKIILLSNGRILVNFRATTSILVGKDRKFHAVVENGLQIVKWASLSGDIGILMSNKISIILEILKWL